MRSLRDSALALWLATVLGLFVVGDSEAGDFGRPKRYMLFGWPQANWATDAPLPPLGSSLSLTIEEVEMRDTAYRLRVRIQNLSAIATDPYADFSYADYLTRAGYLFGPSRLAAIDQELRADHEALSRFGFAAGKVAFADSERMRALRQRSLHASPFDRREAENRVLENCGFIESTFADMDIRFVAYRQAIDRTRIETPAVATESVDMSLQSLRDRAATLQYQLSQVYGVGCVITYVEPPPAFPRAPTNIRPFK